MDSENDIGSRDGLEFCLILLFEISVKCFGYKKLAFSDSYRHELGLSKNKKCNPPLFSLFFLNSLYYGKDERDILEMNCYSFNQIWSPMTKLRGKVRPPYHFTPMQVKFNACLYTDHPRTSFSLSPAFPIQLKGCNGTGNCTINT